MIVRRMIHGEVVQEKEFKNKFFRDTTWNLTYDRFARRLSKLFERRGDFVETVSDDNSVAFIPNCSDSCVKIIY